MKPFQAALAYFAIISAITFFAYGIDKLRAKKGAWRVSEKTLLSLGILGGAFGGLLGMKLFRHKTKHRYFWAVNYAALAIHIAAAIFLAVKLRAA